MILHLINDHQIVERAIAEFEDLFPGQNKVIAFTNHPEEIKFLKGREIVTSKKVKEYVKNYNFEGIKVIWVHYLSFEKIEFLKNVPLNIPVIWWIYGADLYNQFIDPLYFPIYHKAIYKYNKWILFRFKPFLELYQKMRGVYKSKSYIKESMDYSINRINFLYGNPADMELLSELANKKFKCFYSLTSVIEKDMKSLEGQGFSTGKDILVGNSGSCSNNHFYSYKYLKNLNCDNKKIILQMAYGAPSRYYIRKVVSKFKSHFGNNVYPILEYTPLDEYNKSFLNIGTIILSHWRQESVGTSFIAFYLGIKLFLSNKSPMYHQFKKDGYIVFQTEKLSQELLDYELTQEEKIHNRKILENKSKKKDCRENMINTMSQFLS